MSERLSIIRVCWILRRSWSLRGRSGESERKVAIKLGWHGILCVWKNYKQKFNIDRPVGVRERREDKARDID